MVPCNERFRRSSPALPNAARGSQSRRRCTKSGRTGSLATSPRTTHFRADCGRRGLPGRAEVDLAKLGHASLPQVRPTVLELLRPNAELLAGREPARANTPLGRPRADAVGQRLWPSRRGSRGVGEAEEAVHPPTAILLPNQDGDIPAEFGLPRTAGVAPRLLERAEFCCVTRCHAPRRDNQPKIHVPECGPVLPGHGSQAGTSANGVERRPFEDGGVSVQGGVRSWVVCPICLDDACV